MLGLLLRVSRPYYYLVTLWLYLLPAGGRIDLLSTMPFWLGVAYCTLPLNLMCYLMNDLADVGVDEHNPRKGSELLGAKESVALLRAAKPVAFYLQVPFLAAFVALVGFRVLPWFCAVFAVNWLYNFGPQFSSGHHAPLDLLCPCGYLLVVPLCCWLNALAYPPLRSWLHAFVLIVRTQLWIQTFDLEADAAAGRRTTAVRLGMRGAQLLLFFILLGETAFVHASFEHWPLRSLSSGSLALLMAQALFTRQSAGDTGGDGANATPAAVKPALSPASVNSTFLVLGLGGVGLMARVWLDAAFA